MAFDNRPHNRKAEAHTALRCIVASLERLEEQRLPLGRNTRSLINDLDHELSRSGVHANADWRVRRSVFTRVGYEID